MAFASSPAPGVVPNPQTPKLLGTLSIIFASMILLYGLCQSISLVFAPMLGKIMTTTVKTQQDQIDARVKSEEAALDAREKAAKTDEEKAQVEADRAALKARPKTNFAPVNMGLDQLKNPAIIAYSVTDVSTAIVLNSCMLAGGIGLLGLKRWGRTLSIWVAGLKVVRLLGLAIVSLTIIVPIQMEAQRKQFAEIEAMNQAKGAGGGPPMASMGKIAAAATYATMVVYFLLSPIFPIIVLIALNRPRVKAAFPTTAKPLSDWEELK